MPKALSCVVGERINCIVLYGARRAATSDRLRFVLLDQTSLEMLLVGYLTENPAMPGLSSTKNADKLLESGISGRWFQNKSLGLLFEELLSHYRRERCLLNTEEYAVRIRGQNGSDDQTVYSTAALTSCHAAVIARKIRVDLCIERMVNWHSLGKVKGMFRRFEKQASDPKFGPVAAMQSLFAACIAEKRDRECDLPPIENSREGLSNLPPRPADLWDGIAAVGSKMFISGPSKSRKTWTLMGLAMCVSNGVPYWGRNTLKSRVLYINFELTRASFLWRADKIRNALALPLDYYPDMWNLRGKSEAIEDLAPKIIERCRGADYKLIIVDPVYKCIGNRSENDAGDVTSFCNCLESIAIETGACVAAALHFAKGNGAMKEAMDRTSGSWVFSRDPDTLIAMTPHEEDGCHVISTTLRDHPQPPEFVVRWQFPVMTVDSAANPKALKKPGQCSAVKESDILKHTPDHGDAPLPRKIIEGHVKEDTDGGMNAITSKFALALSKGLIIEARKQGQVRLYTKAPAAPVEEVVVPPMGVHDEF